jgi:hypothetical protein
LVQTRHSAWGHTCVSVCRSDWVGNSRLPWLSWLLWLPWLLWLLWFPGVSPASYVTTRGNHSWARQTLSCKGHCPQTTLVTGALPVKHARIVVLCVYFLTCFILFHMTHICSGTSSRLYSQQRVKYKQVSVISHCMTGKKYVPSSFMYFTLQSSSYNLHNYWNDWYIQTVELRFKSLTDISLQQFLRHGYWFSDLKIQ